MSDDATEYAAPVLALAAHLKVEPSEVEASHYDDTMLTCDGAEYRVLTESERETAADESLESYIDECILAEVPNTLRQYFDRDAWKRDALLSDGYGHTLNGYDGEENELTVGGVWFYIYRVN